MRVRVFLALLLTAGWSGAQAGALDISLSNQSATVEWLTDTGSLGYGGADVGFGVFWNEVQDTLLTATSWSSARWATTATYSWVSVRRPTW